MKRSTDPPPSRASALLQEISATHAIVGAHRGISATHAIIGVHKIRRSRLAGERGGSAMRRSTDPPPSRASALLQGISATHAIVGVHKIRRSRLAGERGGSETKKSTDRSPSRASALLQGISATHAIVGAHRGISATHAIVGVHKIRRSRLAGERGGSETEMSTDRSPSRASALLQGSRQRMQSSGHTGGSRQRMQSSGHTPSVGAGLLANAVGQAKLMALTDPVRQQAGSYGGLASSPTPTFDASLQAHL
ncbi:hypothetical protein EC919_11224 [Pseudomonas graminis]|nr:hypothetical protein EC919_11224 [Pseudomonas graminis]